MKKRIIILIMLTALFGLFSGTRVGAALAGYTELDYEKGTFKVVIEESIGTRYVYNYWVKASDESAAKKKVDSLAVSKWDKEPFVKTKVSNGAMDIGAKVATVELSVAAMKKPSYFAYKLRASDKEYKLIKLEKQVQNLKVSYDAEALYQTIAKEESDKPAGSISAGAFAFTLGKVKTGTKVEPNTIQMRYGTRRWVSYSAFMADTLSEFHNHGATLYFRIGANQKYNGNDKTYWPSKEVKIKLTTSANAPSIAVNGSKLSLALKKGYEYSMDGEKWVDASKAHGDSSGKLPSAISIFKLYQSYDTDKKTGTVYNMSAKLLESSQASIFVRKAASGKKPPSKIAECTLARAASIQKEDLPTVSYTLNYSSQGGITLSNTTDSAIEFAVVDASKVFTTGCSLASGTAVSFNAVTLANETKDVICRPVNKADESQILTGQALDGECVDLIATKGDNYIAWTTIGKGSSSKPTTAKLDNKKYSSIAIENRIVLVRYKSIAKTKTEPLKLASDIVILEMPQTLKQSLKAVIAGTASSTTAVTVGSGSNSVKNFTVDLTATNMNATYVSPVVSWVTESGASSSKPAGISTSCSGSDRINNGIGHVNFKVTKSAPSGTYYAKIKAESAEAIVTLEVTNGNPMITLGAGTVSVSGSDSVTIKVAGIASYSAISYSLYAGNVVSGSSLGSAGVYHGADWKLEGSTPGIEGTITIDSNNLPSYPTLCLEVKATNDVGSTTATLVINKASNTTGSDSASAKLTGLTCSQVKPVCLSDMLPADTIGEDPAVTPTTTPTGIQASVDYINEEIEISVPAGSKLYVSTDKKEKDFDRIENLAASGSSLYTRFDISSILSTKPVTVYFRTSMTETSTKVELLGQDSVKVKASGASLVVTGVPEGRVVEYRKGNSSNWVAVTSTTAITTSASVTVSGASTLPIMPTAIVTTGQTEINFDCYTLKGATITLRLKATQNQRVGKEAKGKVAKKANGPNIKIDGTRLSFSGFKANGSEYRLDDNSGYIMVTEKTLNIGSIFGSYGTPSIPDGFVSQEGISVGVMGGTIEVRTAATGKKPASRSKIVEVTSQAIIASGSTVKLSEMVKTKGKTTASYPSITISDASSTNAYEYTLIDTSAKTVDLTKQKWVQIKSSAQTQIKKVGTIETGAGKSLLVRKKSYTDKTTKAIYLASTCLQYNYTSATTGEWASGAAVQVPQS